MPGGCRLEVGFMMFALRFDCEPDKRVAPLRPFRDLTTNEAGRAHCPGMSEATRNSPLSRVPVSRTELPHSVQTNDERAAARDLQPSS